jgi:hypothetical protein
MVHDHMHDRSRTMTYHLGWYYHTRFVWTKLKNSIMTMRLLQGGPRQYIFLAGEGWVGQWFITGVGITTLELRDPIESKNLIMNHDYAPWTGRPPAIYL